MEIKAIVNCQTCKAFWMQTDGRNKKTVRTRRTGIRGSSTDECDMGLAVLLFLSKVITVC